MSTVGLRKVGNYEEVLAQALKDEGPDDRWNAVEALGQIGPEARATVPALAQALKSEDSGVRQCLERA